MYNRNERKTQHKSQVVILVIAYIIYTYIILLEKQNNNSQEGNNIYISDMKLQNSLHIEVHFQERKKEMVLYIVIFLFSYVGTTFIVCHQIPSIGWILPYIRKKSWIEYILTKSLHIIFVYFHNEFHSMYQLLFSFRLTSSDGLFIVNAMKSRSILGKSLCCNTTKVYSRYKNYICC